MYRIKEEEHTLPDNYTIFRYSERLWVGLTFIDVQYGDDFGAAVMAAEALATRYPSRAYFVSDSEDNIAHYAVGVAHEDYELRG